MLTKDVSQELEAIFAALAQQGKEPTVALVKARLKTPVSMPAIITAVKRWKNSQQVPKVEVAAPATEADTDRVAQLEAKVAVLTTRIEALEAELREKKA